MEGMRKVLRAKIHRLTVTHADLNYEGSITLPPELMDRADIREYEAVQVWNVTAGTRFETYAMRGEAGSFHVAVNGAAARLVSVGDIIIVACFSYLPEAELAGCQPRVIFVNPRNEMAAERGEIPGPQQGGRF